MNYSKFSKERLLQYTTQKQNYLKKNSLPLKQGKMLILSKDELIVEKEFFKIKVMKGAVFIHPTDTIYGLGCNALDKEAINKIREIKKRPKEKPFSIIAPSKDWIFENCEVDDEAKTWIDKLPGPYTLILKLKNKEAISKEVNDGSEFIGVRIPNHWISDFVNEHLKFPIVTTSVNLRGKMFMTSLDNLDEDIKISVDFIVSEGEKNGSPSTIVNLANVPIDSNNRKII
jgi:L-threonylcarbamoyladenylate synthase